MTTVINLAEKFGKFSGHWQPRIAAALNDTYVKLAKIEGEFVWHSHASEDELFLVVKGELRMQLRGEDGAETERPVGEGEMIVIPRGTEHRPVADAECWIVLIEPKTTLNTGDAESNRTVTDLEWV